MTSFDAAALTTDVEGLEFLGAVLENGAQPILPDPDAFRRKIAQGTTWSIEPKEGDVVSFRETVASAV